MDPKLLRQREAFRATQINALKKAASATVVKKHEKRPNVEIKEKVAKKPKIQPSTANENSAAKFKPSFDYKTAQGSMVAIFGNLAKIVDCMKKRHLSGQAGWGLTFSEMLEEANLRDLSNRTQQWLLEALPRNPRITTGEDGKYIYKPPYKIKSKSSLLQVLKRHDLEGRAGILMSELADCIPNSEKVVQDLGEVVTVINTNLGKRKDKVLFYNEVDSNIPMDEEFKALWRSVAVDQLDEKKIDEYLHKHGIDSMKDLGQKKLGAGGSAPKRKNVRKRATIMHNQHLKQSGLLMDFSNDD